MFIGHQCGRAKGSGAGVIKRDCRVRSGMGISILSDENSSNECFCVSFSVLMYYVLDETLALIIQ